MKEYDIHTNQTALVKKNYWRIRIFILFRIRIQNKLQQFWQFSANQFQQFFFPSISAMSLPQFFFLSISAMSLPQQNGRLWYKQIT